MAVSGVGDFTRGPGPQTLHVAGLPGFSPLVCYEVIFPGEVADPYNRPKWLVNVTNDGWYGKTAGPRQHFAMARLRAIEEGLPLDPLDPDHFDPTDDPFKLVDFDGNETTFDFGGLDGLSGTIRIAARRMTLATGVGFARLGR